MIYNIASLMTAVFAGVFYKDGNLVLATGCIMMAFLFVVGYFNMDEHKKSVK